VLVLVREVVERVVHCAEAQVRLGVKVDPQRVAERRGRWRRRRERACSVWVCVRACVCAKGKNTCMCVITGSAHGRASTPAIKKKTSNNQRAASSNSIQHSQRRHQNPLPNVKLPIQNDHGVFYILLDHPLVVRTPAIFEFGQLQNFVEIV